MLFGLTYDELYSKAIYCRWINEIESDNTTDEFHFNIDDYRSQGTTFKITIT